MKKRQMIIRIAFFGILAAYPSTTGWCAYDDVNIEDQNVVERRAEIQKQYDQMMRDGDAAKASPDEVVKVINRSRLSLNGAAEREENEERYVDVASTGISNAGLSTRSQAAPPPARKQNNLLFQGLVALGIFLVIAAFARFIPRQQSVK